MLGERIVEWLKEKTNSIYYLGKINKLIYDLKERTKKYLYEKCIDVVKRLRPNLGLLFDVQNIKNRVIQNEFEWVMIRTAWRKFRSSVLILKEEKCSNMKGMTLLV